MKGDAEPDPDAATASAALALIGVLQQPTDRGTTSMLGGKSS